MKSQWEDTSRRFEDLNAKTENIGFALGIVIFADWASPLSIKNQNMNNPVSKRIASIDDDKIQHILVKKRMQLIDPSVEIFPFDDPDHALEWLGNNSVDLIFMDLNFPGLSGWDLLQKIREVSQAPVIVLTGNIGPFEREKIEAYPQAIRLFEKPISSVQVNDVFEYLNAKN